MKKLRTSLLLNWYANPYHTPIFAAKALGYYDEADIQLAILEPNDPGDVTELVGSGAVDLGLKAMIHTIAARAKGYPLKSIGTLLDEPPTGLLALKSSGIRSFHDIAGKRVGYVGEFGKKIIDNLARHAGIDPAAYESVRVGMNVSDAIQRGIIDTGIGFINFQKVELEFQAGETLLLRLDQLAGLGCCCFCSIQLIARDDFLEREPELTRRFLEATQRGAAFTVEDPERAFQLLCENKPALRTEMYRTIFWRTLPFFSRALLNVERDWEKVFRYCRHLEILAKGDPQDFYTNSYLPEKPYCEIAPLANCLC